MDYNTGEPELSDNDRTAPPRVYSGATLNESPTQEGAEVPMHLSLSNTGIQSAAVPEQNIHPATTATSPMAPIISPVSQDSDTQNLQHPASPVADTSQSQNTPRLRQKPRKASALRAQDIVVRITGLTEKQTAMAMIITPKRQARSAPKSQQKDIPGVPTNESRQQRSTDAASRHARESLVRDRSTDSQSQEIRTVWQNILRTLNDPRRARSTSRRRRAPMTAVTRKQLHNVP